MIPNIPSFGFLIHEPVLFDHWKQIFQHLNKCEFLLLFTDSFKLDVRQCDEHRQRLIEEVNGLGYSHAFVSDFVEQDVKVPFVISNHSVQGNSLTGTLPPVERAKNAAKRLLNINNKLLGIRKRYQLHRAQKYISLQCGDVPIRIMYGADISDGWSLAAWNEQYGYIFCHGPNDEAAVKSRFNAETYQIGYPRYDSFFNETVNAEENPFAEEFSLSQLKKTVVWLPTFGEGACSLPYYARHISSLCEKYNVIVRPHPITVRTDSESLCRLQDLGLQVDVDALRDMSWLYAAADFLICDYGGTAFSALYLDKNIVQLEVPGADEWYTSAQSSNVRLREMLEPVVKLREADGLLDLLEDQELWVAQKQQRDLAFKEFFAPYRGTSSERVVRLLREIRDRRHADASSS